MLKVLIALIVFLGVEKKLHAQSNGLDTLFYKSTGEATKRTDANYYKVFFQEKGLQRITERTFYINDEIRTITHFANEQLTKKMDSSHSFFQNGKLHWVAFYDHNGQMVYLKQLHPNGQLKRIEFYKQGQFIKGKKYNAKGKRVRFSRFQQPAKYNGGYKRMIAFLNRNIRYPQQAQDQNISGTVYVSFIVNTDGSVQNPKIERSVHPLLNEEALRVVGIMKQWIPARTNDKAVNARIRIPITFGKPLAEQNIPKSD